ncbi:MAG: hypothetical protein ACO1N3_00670 [Gammaproteobacteria bacterium]
MKNKLSALIIKGTAIGVITSTFSYAKLIYPAEIVGRKLLIYGLGWSGHVGITTTYMMSAEGMSRKANQVIEILNEPIVGQINSIANFKSRSEYWGSKYGIADRGERGYRVLVEANHQRWWCPQYTSDTDYQIGEGNPYTGQIVKCGRWRCDTFVWWAFYSQGWDIMPRRVWIPRVLFDRFPYYNDERGIKKSRLDTLVLNELNNKGLEDVTAEDLNAMSFDEFETIMSSQKSPHYVIPQTGSIEMRFAYDEKLNEAKRSIMIDRLTSRGDELDLTSKLIKLYRETSNVSIKESIISGLMIHYQRHLDLDKQSEEQASLKSFFSELLSEELSSKAADNAIRGFVDLHSSDEIMSNIQQIDSQLSHVNHTSSIMLKYSLIHKSKQLQPIYMESLVRELQDSNDSDLDSYLFGPLSLAYQAMGKNLLEPKSKQIVVNYLKEVRYKYLPSNMVRASIEDPHRSNTAPYYFDLIKNMGGI